jgi:hypothetical protein
MHVQLCMTGTQMAIFLIFFMAPQTVLCLLKGLLHEINKILMPSQKEPSIFFTFGFLFFWLLCLEEN